MKQIKLLTTCLLASLFYITSSALAVDDTLGFPQRLDEIKYNTPDKVNRVSGYERLIADAKEQAAMHPRRPEPKLWAGIALAALADESGWLDALGMVKEARAYLDAALMQRPDKKLKIAIHSILGSLYYKAPRWPVSFGDNNLAVKHLNRALDLDPKGLDAHFWMASYLWEETNNYKAAAGHFRMAIKAPTRADRRLRDEGRKKEAKRLLIEVEQEMSNNSRN